MRTGWCFYMKKEQRMKLEEMCCIDHWLTLAVARCFNVTYHINHFLLFFNGLSKCFLWALTQMAFRKQHLSLHNGRFQMLSRETGQKTSSVKKCWLAQRGAIIRCQNEVRYWIHYRLLNRKDASFTGGKFFFPPLVVQGFFCPLSIACICSFFILSYITYAT